MQTLEKVKNIIPLPFGSTMIVMSILKIERYSITILIYCNGGVYLENRDIYRNICIEKSDF